MVSAVVIILAIVFVAALIGLGIWGFMSISSGGGGGDGGGGNLPDRFRIVPLAARDRCLAIDGDNLVFSECPGNLPNTWSYDNESKRISGFGGCLVAPGAARENVTFSSECMGNISWTISGINQSGLVGFQVRPTGNDNLCLAYDVQSRRPILWPCAKTNDSQAEIVNQLFNFVSV